MRNVLQHVVVLCVVCLCSYVYGMEEDYDESFERAQQAELNREIGVARHAYLAAYRENNTVLQQRILDLFSDMYHDNIKVLAACLKEWNDYRSLAVATRWFVVALRERDEHFYNQIYQLVDDDDYRATLLTEVNMDLLQENASAQSSSVVPVASDFIDTANMTYLTEDEKHLIVPYRSDEDLGLKWTYDLSEGGFDKAWLIIQKS